MKNRPFLISSLLFGVIGLALLVIAGLSFINHSTAFTAAIASLLKGDPNSLSNAVIAELGVVFMIPSFIFAYKSFADTEYEWQTLTAMKNVSESVSETPTPSSDTSLSEN